MIRRKTKMEIQHLTYAFWQFGVMQCDKCKNAFRHHVKCQSGIIATYLLELYSNYNDTTTYRKLSSPTPS